MLQELGPDQKKPTLDEVKTAITDELIKCYDGTNAKVIADFLKDLMGAYQGSVDLDNARLANQWGGEPIATMVHPITGKKFKVYIGYNSALIKVPIEE